MRQASDLFALEEPERRLELRLGLATEADDDVGADRHVRDGRADPLEPVEVVPTGDREADVDAIVTRFTEVLEKWVRLVPEQYFWQHRRWKRQPPDTPLELRDPTRNDA